MQKTALFVLFQLVIASLSAPTPAPVPGHLPPTKAGEWQTFSSLNYATSVNGKFNDVIAEFSNEHSDLFLIVFAGGQDVDFTTDHPHEVSVRIPIAQFEGTYDLAGAPELTMYFAPLWIYNRCHHQNATCFEEQFTKSEVTSSAKASGKDMDVIFDITQAVRISERYNTLFTYAYVKLTKNGNNHYIKLNASNVEASIILEPRSVNVEWPPRKCDSYDIILSNPLHPDLAPFSQDVNINVIDCPGPHGSNKVIDLLVPVPGHCYHYRNIIDYEFGDEQLTDHARVICWNPIGHGTSGAPSWEEFNMTIPLQEMVMNDVYNQLLGPDDKVMGVTHDRQSIVFESWCSRPENADRCAGGQLDEAWLSTICSDAFEAAGICSKLYYLDAAVPTSYGPFPIFNVGNYDGSPVEYSCTNNDTVSLIHSFVDCTFDREHCGYDLHVNKDFFFDKYAFLNTGPGGISDTYALYHNPNTGVAQPADWEYSMINFYTTPVDPDTCTLLPTGGLALENLTPLVVFTAEEMYQYKLPYDTSVYGPVADDRQAKLGQQPLGIPMRKQWSVEKSGWGQPGNSTVEFVRDVMDRIAVMDPIFVIMDTPGSPHSVIPILDRAELESYPSTRVYDWNPNYPHWAADSNPGAKHQRILWTVEDLTIEGRW